VAGLATSFGSGAMTNSIEEIPNYDVLLVVGSNTTEAHPIIGQKMKQAAKKGAKIIVCDPRHIELVDYAYLWLPVKPGTNIVLTNAMMKVIIDENLMDRKFIEERTENFEELSKAVREYSPQRAQELTGVPADDIIKAARLYATTPRAGIFYTLGVTEHVSGTYNVINLANLAMLTGHVGREYSGVNPLRGQNNVQGACDMGALPDVFPGYQKVFEPAVREKFASFWGLDLDNLDENKGFTSPEMIDLAYEGFLKALYVMGEDPALTDPNINHVREALAKLDFLVVQDLFLTETAKYADVFLPAASFLEKEGTFTNTERRVQRVRKALNPKGNSKPDWEIISLLAQKMGYPMPYSSAEEIFNEMASLTPSYAGMSYARLEKEGLQWPCPTVEHPGTKVLHVGNFSRGKGYFKGIEHIPSAELTDDEYPLLLTTGRMLYHYGITTRHSPTLMSFWPEELIEINPIDARKLNLETGDKVKISSRRGSVVTKVRLTEKVQPGIIFMSYHFADTPVNILTNDVFDPISKTAEYKVAAVRIEPVP